MSSPPVKLSIDGKWVACLPAGNYGFLGNSLPL